MARAFARGRDPIRAEDLEFADLRPRPTAAARVVRTLKEVEREAILVGLEAKEYVIAHAAKALGVDESTLARKIVKYGIPRP